MLHRVPSRVPRTLSKFFVADHIIGLRQASPPLVCAHGGNTELAFPNTVAAIRAVMTTGAACVEACEPHMLAWIYPPCLRNVYMSVCLYSACWMVDVHLRSHDPCDNAVPLQVVLPCVKFADWCVTDCRQRACCCSRAWLGSSVGLKLSRCWRVHSRWSESSELNSVSSGTPQ